MAERIDTPMPMSAADAVEYFQSCADAFACLLTIVGAIQDTDNPTAKDGLLIAVLHIAKRYADLAGRWRNDLKAGGFQS